MRGSLTALNRAAAASMAVYFAAPGHRPHRTSQRHLVTNLTSRAKTFLGIDLGTSELKLLLLDETHRVIATVAEPLSISRPQPRWSEQAPQDWWLACCKALDRLATEQADAMSRVAAIGLSGQMHGAVLLDADNSVLRPAILWNDGRSDEECILLAQRAPHLSAITGNLAMPGFTAPKLLWVAANEPQIFAATHTVLLPKDWLRLQLTGECVSEMSDAAGTLWLDTARREWSRELLAATGLCLGHMPRLVEGCDLSGYLHGALAARWGLPARVPVAGGGGDNAASAAGIGVVNAGEGFLSLGTSGVLFVANAAFSPAPALAVHAFCHALPDRWHQMSVMLSAASCLRWVTKLTRRSDEAALLAEVTELSAAARARAPLFLPYLSGERSPHNDPHASGVFFGLTHEHDAAALGYAVLEGVAFGFRDGLRALQTAGAHPDRISLVGGGARSALWSQLLASVLGVDMLAHRAGEAGAALGAARLAWLCVGGREADVCTRPAVIASWSPRAADTDFLEDRYQRYVALYPALKTHFLATHGTPSRAQS